MESFLKSNIRNLPRGLRNNNPGNLRISNIQWQGKVPLSANTDKSFEQFTTLHYGVRAMLTDVANDITIKEFNTLKKLVNSYAPPTENDTTKYINYVSSKTGLSKDAVIKLSPDILKKIVKAKISMENGERLVNQYLPNIDAIIDNAINDLNPATKTRINWVKTATGAGTILLLVAGIIFFLAKKN